MLKGKIESSYIMSPRKSKVNKLEEKISKLENSLADERKTSEKYLSQLKYARADLENLQKRTQRRIDEAQEKANGRIVMQLLTILDELDLAISAAKDSKGDVIEGIEMVRGKLWKLLHAEGLAPVDALGRPFDPNLHEAVLEVETDEVENGCIIEEFRKGYKFKGRVLRASMVKIAKNPGSNDVKEENEDE
jgi:molecular chaperone GrpE